MRNTTKSTVLWLNVWESWCSEKDLHIKIEETEPKQLNHLLERFYAEVKTKDGRDYEPDSLRVMIAALDRHLKDNDYKYSIIKDRQFASSKQVLEGKARQLREEGNGKRPNKARSLTKEEEETLWQEKKFGNDSPEALIGTMWWLLTQFFGLRGRQEHHVMKIEDFRILKDDQGVEFVEYSEGITKTRQGGLHVKQRDFKPRMFAVGGDRCPVALFKEYIHRRPGKLRNQGPFYLGIKHNRRADDEIWFKVQPMGVNRINYMMKYIISGTSLAEQEKKFTNHSARKTVVSKLKRQVERSSVAKVTGHKSLESINDYDEADEEEQRSLSLAISRRNNNATAIQKYGQQLPSTSEIHRSPVQVEKGLSQVEMSSQLSLMSKQNQNMLNTFNNCQVAINFTTLPKSPLACTSTERKRQRYHFLDSDDSQ